MVSLSSEKDKAFLKLTVACHFTHNLITVTTLFDVKQALCTIGRCASVIQRNNATKTVFQWLVTAWW